MTLRVWTEVLAASMQELWLGFVAFVPTLVGALVVFILGLIVASGLGALMERVVEVIKLQKLVERAGVEPYFKRAGVSLNVGRFFGRLMYWFILIAFFLAAADILQFSALSAFLRSVLLYIPQVVVAALIMLASAVVANFVRNVVTASVKGANHHTANFLGALSWWAIIVFGFFAALSQLGIAVSIINTLVTGFVAMFALAGGIAFGLGGKDYASHLLGKFRNQVENK